VREGFPELEVEIRCPKADDEVSRIEAVINSFGRSIGGEKLIISRQYAKLPKERIGLL
jgi:hypothetical protein